MQIFYILQQKNFVTNVIRGRKVVNNGQNIVYVVCERPLRGCVAQCNVGNSYSIVLVMQSVNGNAADIKPHHDWSDAI